VDTYEIVASDAGLARLVEAHADSDAVVVDTEFMRRDTFYPKAGLLQLCFSGNDTIAWLVDPLAITDYAPLRELMSNTAIVKVIHSASEDLEVFQQLLGCLPRPLFDTQRAAALLNLGFGLGYRALVAELTGREIPKEETRSDWLARPLSDSQLAYAAADVVPLLPIYRQLRDRLSEAGRLEWLLEDGDNAITAVTAPPAPSYARVKSAWKLSGRQLAVLAAVCDWREERARRLDKPRNWILQDKLCLQVAEVCPTSPGQLGSLEGMPAAVVRKQGDVLLRLVADALNGERPAPAPLPRPLTGPQRESLKALKGRARELAQEWQVAPEILLPSGDYELLVRRASGEAIQAPRHWQGWRKEPLLTTLSELAEAV
jgi:ribonuclease D